MHFVRMLKTKRKPRAKKKEKLISLSSQLYWKMRHEMIVYVYIYRLFIVLLFDHKQQCFGSIYAYQFSFFLALPFSLVLH